MAPIWALPAALAPALPAERTRLNLARWPVQTLVSPAHWLVRIPDSPAHWLVRIPDSPARWLVRIPDSPAHWLVRIRRKRAPCPVLILAECRRVLVRRR